MAHPFGEMLPVAIGVVIGVVLVGNGIGSS